MTTDYNQTDAFDQTTMLTNIHTTNINFTNLMFMTDKHNIPKGKIHSNCRLLPNHIVCKITQLDYIRRANTCDPALKLLNEEITSDIHKHKQNLWKEHLDAHLDHRHNTHIIWNTIHSISNRVPLPTLNSSITFSNKIATTPKHIASCFTNQFTNTVQLCPIGSKRHRLQTTQPTSGGAVTVVSSCCANCVEPPRPQQWGPDLPFFGHAGHLDL